MTLRELTEQARELVEASASGLVAAGGALTGKFLNCRLFVQLVMKTPLLEKLPLAKGAMKVGDVLQWGENPGRHWAIFVGEGNVLEVAEWGAEPKVTPLASVVREYEEPIVRRKRQP